jgi:hypothetical protein
MIRTTNKQFRKNRGLGGGLPDVLNALVGGANSPKVIIRSNITPEITIDIAQLMKPGAAPATSVQGDNAVLMNLIKPEVVVTGLGVEKVTAPYGRPRAGMFMVVATGIGVAAALGGLIAWKICRG